MTTTTTASTLSRFYAMTLPDAVAEARDEALTDLETDDLFVAHLQRNHGYFGALDKTLSGFVVLSDEGDDAWLYDARDTGAVYFQSHEDRSFSARFASLDDWRNWCRDKAAAPDDEALDARYKLQRALVSRRKVPTAALARRLQWAVWMFAQPMPRDLGTDAVNRETHLAIDWFLDQLGADPEGRFSLEKEHIPSDPHLALSWLLVAAALASPTMFAEVVALAPRNLPLIEHFARRLTLGPSDTLAVLPSFAMRRGRLLMALAWSTEGPPALARIEAAITACPDDQALAKALCLGEIALALGHPEALRRVGEACGDLRVAVLARGMAEGAAAQKGALDARKALEVVTCLDEPLSARVGLLDALWGALDDGDGLAAALALLDEDPYHFGLLERASAAARAAGDARGEALEARRAAVAEIREVYAGCHRRADGQTVAKALAEADGLRPEARALLARRVLAAPQHFHRALVERTLLISLHTPGEPRARDWAMGLGALGKDGVEAMRKVRPTLDAATRTALWAVLEGEIPAEGPPIVRESTQGEVRVALVRWLVADGDGAEVDALLSRLESGSDDLRRVIVGTILNPFDPGYQVARMSDAQGLGAARALATIQRTRRENKRLFHDAGHQLARMHHKGAAGFLFEALRAEQDLDIVANLYAAVRGMAGDDATAFLIDRLFEERRAYWRLSDALGKVWDRDVHTRIVARIGASLGRGGERAAAAYVAALVEHLKQSAAVLDVARAMTAPSGRDEDDARRAYVLLEGARVAMTEKDDTLATELLAAARAIAAEPVSDYHTIDRKTPWRSAFETDPELAARAAALHARALENAAKTEARDARAKRRLKLKLTDAALSAMAGATVAQRLFHDTALGTIWALTETRAFVYFDGVSVVAPPFEAVLSPSLAVFLRDATGFSERATLWSPKVDRCLDAARYGAHLVLVEGRSDGAPRTVGLRFRTEREAAAAMARWRASPLKGYALGPSWYLPRRGAVVRTSEHPKDGDAFGIERVAVHATERALEDHAERRWFAALRAHPDGRIVSLGWTPSLRCHAEMSLADALRALSEDRDVALQTALDLPLVMREKVRATCLGDLVEIESAPPEDPSHLGRLDAIEDTGLREVLRAVYTQIGARRVQVAKAVGEFLPLSSVRGAGSVIARQGGRNVTLEQIGALASLGEGVVSFVLCAHVPEAVVALVPDAQGRLCGAPAEEGERTVRMSAAKGAVTAWRATLDLGRRYYFACESRKGRKDAYETKCFDDETSAQKAFDAAVARREAKGFTHER